MTILNLNTLLTENAKNAFFTLPISTWKGKRIAFDSSIILHKYFSPAWKEVVMKTNVLVDEPDMKEVSRIWLKNFKVFLLRFLNQGITPIFVIDGKPPIEKEIITRQKRKEGRDKKNTEIETIKNTMTTMDRLSITSEMINELRKKMSNLPPTSKSELDVLKSVLEGLGIPVLQAKGEAEELCSTLCRLGYVDAVFSSDLDNLAHGCPVLITDCIGKINNQEHVKTIILKDVLDALNVTHQVFLDLCIMCGCDYNNNIYRVGVKTAYKLLLDCQTIDNLTSKYDITCLNHIRCRELFSQKKYDEVDRKSVV